MDDTFKKWTAKDAAEVTSTPQVKVENGGAKTYPKRIKNPLVIFDGSEDFYS
ncbi:Hypothetical protein FKW44_021657 [Caligus rogercresseyi]|uniref:Uncharacterized protein n=1 Tax=Caligus rogercresseyi TaxID=217165 RepID=A0A7T8GS35_CALRO|nr:Hypothetical protein FKW44_021657 [Caligus rogercresseyi]